MAGWTRVVLGLLSLFALPLLYPRMAAHRSVFAAYLAFALGAQLFVLRRRGGRGGAIVLGFVDLTVVTFLVHSAGSVATPLAALYVICGVLNTMAVGLRAGLAMALGGSVAFAALVASEAAGALPYGPDAPVWAAGPPTVVEAVVAALLLATMSLVSTGVVGWLERRVRQHESELAAANARLEQLSVRDPLTQLYNRRHLLERIEVELARVHRGHPLAVAMVDLDGFKRINDEQGHQRGDKFLQRVGTALVESVRASDVACRYGGDEFVVLVTDSAPDDARTAAERLVTRLRDVGAAFSPQRPITASVGLAMARPGEDAATLLRRADRETYRAKREGGDRVAIASIEVIADDEPAPREVSRP